MDEEGDVIMGGVSRHFTDTFLVERTTEAFAIQPEYLTRATETPIPPVRQGHDKEKSETEDQERSQRDRNRDRLQALRQMIKQNREKQQKNNEDRSGRRFWIVQHDTNS
ncbi:hypothetical protein FLONG3_5830 [Fusarium longipes]|uniref:Uncharacterized protein n=1 Tax=Fusarium longipes TaxID=694270 RepID=A0A395SS19_9HYPO|nr:hypothetical protein FLONG3_5830 [Fusarium longipes]